MKLLIVSRIVFLSLGLSWSILAHTAGLSAHRDPKETYESAVFRSYVQSDILSRSQLPQYQNYVSNFVSAQGSQKPLEDLDIHSIPEVQSYEALEKEFKFIRDTRFLETNDPLFPRRLTWLYPDDGCYARAEMAKKELIKNRFLAPKKIFVFGDLSAVTENGPGGEVRWWYHVAITYRVADTVYIFDPSINARRPMTLEEWNMEVGGEETSARYSICSANTFDPRGDCVAPQEVSLEQARAEQNSFLQPEWSRIMNLGRDPEVELGDSPPWSGY